MPHLEPAPLRVREGAASRQPDVEQLAVRQTPVADGAVFSAGRGNAFGHPAPEVVARYEAVGAEIFRTDRDGAVFFDTDGYSLEARTFLGRTVLWPRKHENTKGIDDQSELATGR